MQKVGVDGERRLAFLVLGDGDLVIARELREFLAALEGPLAPGRDDLDAGLERVIAEFEADLVVALAGGAMADGVGARFARDLDLLLGDQRAGDGRAEQVDAFVDGVGAEHREDVVAHELFAQVLDEDVLGLDAEHLGFLARGSQLLALAQVGGEGDDLGAVLLLQPLQNNGGVEAAGVSQHNLLDACLCAGLRRHPSNLSQPFEMRAHYRQSGWHYKRLRCRRDR